MKRAPTKAAIAAAAAVGLLFGAAPAAGAERPFPPERGRLRIEGPRFYSDDNRVWRWRGATGFLLFARYLNGEDISPQLDWLVDRGFNVVRVFGEVPGGFGADKMGITNYERPFERQDFDAKLHAFFTLLADRGLRCEYTVLTYWDAMSTMRMHVQRVFDIAATHWNVLVEVANEPENNGIDAVAVMQNVNRRGVLAAYGIDPARAQVHEWKRSVRVLDYGTSHDLDRSVEASPTVTKKTTAMQSVFGVPFVNDEPIGAIDPGHPTFKETGPQMWGGVRGGGARTVNRNVFISAAAIAYMYSAGYTYHFQAGLEGRLPTRNHPIQDGVALALREVAKFIPNDAQLGTPVDSLPDGGVGVVLGNQQWVVVPNPPQGWSPKPPAGWRIDAVGPVPYIYRLAR